MMPNSFHCWSRPGLALLVSLVGVPAWADTRAKVDFAHDIVPLLKARCAECHTNGKRKGSLSMDTREDLLKAKVAVPGKSADSELLRRVRSEDPEERMPPKGTPLSAVQVALLQAWIDQGLPWEEGFSFRARAYAAPLKLRRPVLPPARAGHDHPIDRLLDADYARRHVEPPAPLDDAAFARRVYLDLIGLLPAPAELDAFLRDAAPDKRARLIRRLLGEQRAYAEHWLTFWNDLLRNDYQGTGYIDGGRKQITGWLYRSLLENKPYDRFVRELIRPTPESEGFIRGIKWRGTVNASQVPELQFSQNVAQVFFGVNLKCASCHDSFIDSWKLDDAYSLAAVVADRPLEIYRCDKATGRKASPRFLWPALGTIDASQPAERRLERLAGLVTGPDNGRFTRTIVNRLWQRLFGRGIVHPVDVMANKPWEEDLLDYLAAYLADHGYDLKQLIEHVTTSRAYQSRPVAVPDEMPVEDYIFRGPQLKRMTAEQFLDAVWQVTRTAPEKAAEQFHDADRQVIRTSPEKAAASVTLPPFPPATPTERRFIRAALVNADALMRSLGRPNREQVVTTRPDQLTTLQALDLSNGQILTDTLARGAANLVEVNPHPPVERLIEEVYIRALCRRPTVQELATGREILGSAASTESLADLLWVVVMLPEFQLIR
jgi:hypothetical protein